MLLVDLKERHGRDRPNIVISTSDGLKRKVTAKITVLHHGQELHCLVVSRLVGSNSRNGVEKIQHG